MNPCTGLPRYLVRTLACVLAVALLLAQFGCATRPPSIDLHYQLRNEVTALVPARLETKLSLEPFAVGRSSGALEGAGAGFVGCLQGFGSGSCSGEICGAVLLVILGLAVACSVVGAVAGAIQATPADDAGTMSGSIAQVTQQLASHLNLTRQVVAKAGNVEGVTVELVDEEELVGMEEAQRWQALRARGFVNALEIGVTEIEFAGGSGSDPELSLMMIARARLIELATGEEQYREEFRHVAAPRRFSQWAANQGAFMKREVGQGLEHLSTGIASCLFEQVSLPVSSGTWALPGSERYGCCWLCPIQPPLDYDFWGRSIRYPRVSTRQPTLSWQEFPLPEDAAALSMLAGNQSLSVYYDLRIWEVRNNLPGELVYERVGLPAPEHRLAVPLKPQNHYYWSFRACVNTERGIVCTPWAFSLFRGGVCEQPTIPVGSYYRFAVP